MQRTPAGQPWAEAPGAAPQADLPLMSQQQASQGEPHSCPQAHRTWAILQGLTALFRSGEARSPTPTSFQVAHRSFSFLLAV